MCENADLRLGRDMTDTAEHLTSPKLVREGFRHAFFTRRGGFSPAPFDSLHFGSSGHAAEALAANVRTAAAKLAVDPARLYTATQVHGRDAIVVRGTEDRSEVLQRKADAVGSAARGVACGVKIADCVPVLVGDRASGAALAIHSGWQGTCANVVAAGVAALRDELGRDGELVAAIGPHIELCCFEVSDDVAQRLAACAPAVSVVDRGRGPKPHVDLRAIIRAQLDALGIANDAIDDVYGCTRCDAARFFSYRRDRENSGRLLAAIAVRD
jgi:YfiH family protein